MSSFKREWSVCKICEHYYNETCDKIVKKECNFKPSNDFIQFLSVNNLQLTTKDNYLQPVIYFVEKDFDISLIEENKDKQIDLRNESIENIVPFLSSTKFGKVVFISIDEEYRNVIYNNDWVMKFYFVRIALDKKYATKYSKYKLDQRFNIMYF